LKKNKIIFSGLFLTSVISCGSFKTYVLTEAYLLPESTTEVTYDDINWSYALFNQYASGLSYSLRIDYSTYHYNNVYFSISPVFNGSVLYFQDWTTVTATYAEATSVSPFWTNVFNQTLFNRDFDRTTKKAVTSGNAIRLIKWVGDTINLEINFVSKINYNVNIGSVYQAFGNGANASIDTFNKFIFFYNSRDDLLQTILLDQDRTGVNRNYVYDLSTVLTDVRKFTIKYQWLDFPPFVNDLSIFYLYEFNIFTQSQEIRIPDDATGDRFGFEFVVVEWWDILGHLQNFAWWIVNQSPLRPLFEWLDTYIISWIRSFIDILTGVFDL
jgi:hypothetical protein